MRVEVPPERLGRWLERWAAEHGGVARAATDEGALVLTGADGTILRCEPPFPPLEGPPAVPTLLAHVARERVVGVLLVRLGGHAVGVFAGRELVASGTGRRLVHGRHRAGGSSSGRFARRREGQARLALVAAADDAARVLLVRPLDAVVLGGDRAALRTVLADRRLSPLRERAEARILDVPDPRFEVLRSVPEKFLATVLTS